MGLSKLIKKVNKAKSAINSLKGISSKLQSLNYDSVTDQLGEEAKKAQEYLRDTRKRDSSLLAQNERRMRLAESPPQPETEELMYPMGDILENYLLFKLRPRRINGTIEPTEEGGGYGSVGGNNANLFSNTAGKKFNKEILLYIPNDFSSTANANYTTADFGLGARQMDAFIERASGGDVMGAVSEAGVTKLVNQGITSMLNKLQGGVKNVREGRAKNPMTESMFEGVGFREFNFEYQFWPKNELEQQMVNHIIYTFRTAMLPDTFGSSRLIMKDGKLKTEQKLNDDENYYNHPNIFDVAWEGPIKQHVDGFLPMVCKKCDVKHFNNGNTTTFANGAPVSVSMSLGFQEIKQLTQESYQEISAMYNGQEPLLQSMKSFAAGETRQTQPIDPKG